MDGEPSLPSAPVLERLVSVCYQASLLRDEGRPITFRVTLAPPERFRSSDGPPTELHRLTLTRARPFDEHEIRRLAPAARFERALIGVRIVDGDLEIWGVVHSGPRWLQDVRGGRLLEQSIPPVLMAAVTGPGRVLVSKGAHTLASLANGRLHDAATDVFRAQWLEEWFAAAPPGRRARPSDAEEPRVDPSIRGHLARHVLRRVVSRIRSARHGGMVVLLRGAAPGAGVEGLECLAFNYAFDDEEPRRRIETLTERILGVLIAAHHASRGDGGGPVGWAEYEASTDARITALDEALFEVAHLVAMLADVDGAVVMTDRFEVLGFGAEIVGSLADGGLVDRSLDVDATRRVAERTDRVGTRHRAAYRLCHRLHDALVVVVSQDGGVRFVRWIDGRVTYFDQIATGPWEV